MRYRRLTADGDYSFGRSAAEFFVDDPDGVAQSVQTRLLLLQGEWFLDRTDGTPYSTEILGTHTAPIYDQAIKQRILTTQNVTGITSYSSSRDPKTRKLSVSAEITTAFGPATVSVSL